jgi:hypothetical protein
MIAVHKSFTFIKLNDVRNDEYFYAITVNFLCLYLITYSERAV